MLHILDLLFIIHFMLSEYNVMLYTGKLSSIYLVFYMIIAAQQDIVAARINRGLVTAQFNF